MRKYVILLIVMLLLTSCGRNPLVLDLPNETLLEFLQSTTDSYNGDSSYFHVIKTISIEETNAVILLGEVKNNSTGGTKREYEFEITCKVDGNRIIQNIEGSRLNDSDYNGIVLLEAPVEIGHKWHFKATDHENKTVTFNAEIIDVLNNGNAVKVRYETKEGYYEERTLYKGRGTIDFVKGVSYKGTSIITGYHSTFDLESAGEIASSTSNEVETSLEPSTVEIPLVSINLPVSIYNLLLGFNQSWDGYINDGNDAIWKLIEENSPASEKLSNIDLTANDGYRFSKFYAYDLTEEKPYLIVSIVETYEDEKHHEIKNKVIYWISNSDTVPKIYDFSGNN